MTQNGSGELKGAGRRAEWLSKEEYREANRQLDADSKIRPPDLNGSPNWGYVEMLVGGRYKLFDTRKDDFVDEQASPFKKPGVRWILEELEKPASERDHDTLEAGIAMIDKSVFANIEQHVKAGKLGVARHLLEAYDPRCRAMTDDGWTAFLETAFASATSAASVGERDDSVAANGAAHTESNAQQRRKILLKTLRRPGDLRDPGKLTLLADEFEKGSIGMENWWQIYPRSARQPPWIKVLLKGSSRGDEVMRERVMASLKKDFIRGRKERSRTN